MITKTSEYALRAVVLLTENEGARLTLQVIARHTQVPSSYLSKVLQGLVHHGVVTSVRGPAGGFALARPPSCITVRCRTGGRPSRASPRARRPARARAGALPAAP
ncbi:MAG: Rrf2 family transcriptional regulator [Myxococcales bacterium]|nr:Rrf2 family transcriptional regulator [Myxococcales bacterium]